MKKPVHDPLKNPKKPRLLSRMQVLKGRIIPQALQLGMCAISFGFGAMSVGTIPAALGVLGLIGLRVFREDGEFSLGKMMQNTIHKAYDFSKEEDRTAFIEEYPEQKNFPKNYLKLCEGTGVKELPTLFVDTKNQQYEQEKCHFSDYIVHGEPIPWKNRAGFITVNAHVFEQPEDLTFSFIGHEMGHIKQQHAQRGFASRAMKTIGSGLVMGAAATMPLIASGGVLLGLGSAALCGYLSHTLQQHLLHKIARSNEHEADSFASVHTPCEKIAEYFDLMSKAKTGMQREKLKEEFGIEPAKVNEHWQQPVHPRPSTRRNFFSQVASRYPTHIEALRSQFNFGSTQEEKPIQLQLRGQGQKVTVQRKTASVSITATVM